MTTTTASEATESAPETRLTRRFAELKAKGRSGFVTFITAGDPDYDTSLDLLRKLPAAGADVIELGMPFTDPMADGPAIQAANLRALKSGMTLRRTIDMVAEFRAGDSETPIVLMGYFNPIFSYGVDRFLKDAKASGVDGLIVVDLPPEEDNELCLPALAAGFNFIRLATPTTDDKRLPAVLAHTSGFVYYVSVTGITGAGSASDIDIETAVKRLSAHTDLPIAVGFGISTPEQAAAVARVADAAVVGSAIIKQIEASLDAEGHAKSDLAVNTLSLVEKLSAGIHAARQ